MRIMLPFCACARGLHGTPSAQMQHAVPSVLVAASPLRVPSMLRPDALLFSWTAVLVLA